MTNEIKDFHLGISGFKYSDLYAPDRLKDLHVEFWKYVGQVSPGLQKKFSEMGKATLTKPEESDTLLEVAKHLGDFLAKLFTITNHTLRLKKETDALQPTFVFKKEFLHLRCYKRYEERPLDDTTYLEVDGRVKRLISHHPPSAQNDPEIIFAETVVFLVESEKRLKANNLEGHQSQSLQNLCSGIHGNSLLEKIQSALQDFEDWCVHTFIHPERKKVLEGWVSFVRPGKLHFDHLVSVEKPRADLPEEMVGLEKHLRHRDGFKLTDARMTQKECLREIDYCIYCHSREKDSCNRGFPEKTGGYKRNPLGIALEGCPLDERISEMHVLRKQGDVIAALAMIMLDNPMCPGTGHRICNDCMKGCIFQKQDPVNIPQTETGILTDVLGLPYGFEIYSLLTRFNPLNHQRPFALPYNGVNVLVVGLGPAGYTLAHYLANEGFGVIGIDALKLEPVDSLLTGIGRAYPKPIQNTSELKKDLDERILMGFGGVSEYGITVRWDKNFLAVIYLTLLRRKNTRFYGGVRFGGTLTLDDAWELGFQHVAVATGAGRPTIIDMKNNLIRGIRKASDFLMALQLTGAFKKASLANLQVQLPALVIGGGLTAVDTATELLAYYPVQVEKALERFEVLSRQYGEDTVWKMCSEEESEVLKTFLEHGREIRNERVTSQKERRSPNFIALCRKWGGVSIVYRKRLIDSPAYRLNHEEVAKALEEGISFIENLTPVEAEKDRFGVVSALKMKRDSGEIVSLPARTVCVAAGTSPNTIYEREYPGTFKLDDKRNFFRKHVCRSGADGTWELVEAKSDERDAFFLSYQKDGKFVTYYGDNHPDYAGNVVKAMASAKHGMPQIAKLFQKEIAMAERGGIETIRFTNLIQTLDQGLIPRVVRVDRLTPTIVEVIVKGRYVSRKFRPGQFFRLQNYETISHRVDGQTLAMEGIALTGAWVKPEEDLLSLIVLEMGGSSRLCALLEPGDPVIVMGPTGTPSEIPKNQTVLLVGGGLGNAVLLSIAKALKENGCDVVYFAGYKKPEDIFKQDEIEKNTDQVIWACDTAPGITARRKQDFSFVGNIIQAIDAYATGKLNGPPMFPLKEVEHLLVIGSDRMMAAASQARHAVLKPHLKPNHAAVASINSPMQCMMKEVCAQCLQRHVDPKTGKESYVFSCFNQDQLMDCVDWNHLNERLRGNSLAEKLVNRHLDYLLQRGKVEKA